MSLDRQLARMDDLAEGYSTKADKMRVLEQAGYKRADIARFLGVRYQQVRNTLEGDKRTGYKPDLTPSRTAVDGREYRSANSSGFISIEVDDDGFGLLPPELLQGVSGNDEPLYAVKGAHGIFVGTLSGMSARIRATMD